MNLIQRLHAFETSGTMYFANPALRLGGLSPAAPPVPAYPSREVGTLLDETADAATHGSIIGGIVAFLVGAVWQWPGRATLKFMGDVGIVTAFGAAVGLTVGGIFGCAWNL